MQTLGAALASFTGKAWTRQAVWDAEQGRRVFTAAELLALAGVLGVTVPQLFETAESVVMPSGEPLPAASLDSLLAGTNRDKDRTQALRHELRGLKETSGALAQLQMVLRVQIERAERALAGAPEFDPDTGSGQARDWALTRANEQAQKWAYPDTRAVETTWKEEQ